MIFGIENQLLFMGAGVISGFLMSFVYDILRAKRKMSKSGALLVNLEDIIFILFSGFVFLYITYEFNSGAVRLTGFLTVASGGILYFFIFRNKMVGLICTVSKLVLKILRIFLKILIFPFAAIWRIFRKPVRIIAWRTGSFCGGLKRKCKAAAGLAKRRISLISLFVKKK